MKTLNLCFTESFAAFAAVTTPTDDADDATKVYAPGQLQALLAEASPRRCATTKLPRRGRK
jgi:hypothetical protein